MKRKESLKKKTKKVATKVKQAVDKSELVFEVGVGPLKARIGKPPKTRLTKPKKRKTKSRKKRR